MNVHSARAALVSILKRSSQHGSPFARVANAAGATVSPNSGESLMLLPMTGDMATPREVYRLGAVCIGVYNSLNTGESATPQHHPIHNVRLIQ